VVYFAAISETVLKIPKYFLNLQKLSGIHNFTVVTHTIEAKDWGLTNKNIQFYVGRVSQKNRERTRNYSY
jgi:hypothetical protein